MLRNTAREFLAAELPMAEVRRIAGSDTAQDSALWKKLAAQGWTGILFDETYDGAGMGLVESAVILEEMGRALLPGPFFSTVMLAGTCIDAAASDEQKHTWLKPICQGVACSTLALLERSASWDVDAVELTATGSRLNGEKLFVPDAGAASFLVVAARAGSDLALFIVDCKAPGVTITPMAALDLTRRLDQVTFHNVEATPLATGDKARQALQRALDVAAAGLCAEMTGGMQRVLDQTVQYAKTRKQFGAVIGQFQAVQHLCADMLVYTESSRSAAYYAAWALQERIPEARLAVSSAKSYTSEAYREVGNRGIQVHGGMGFTWENDLHLYYRRAKASEIAFGDAVFHRERIASLLLAGNHHS